MSSSLPKNKPLQPPLITRLLRYFWTNQIPYNTLNHSTFIKPENLKRWRIISFLYNSGLLTTAFLVAPKVWTPLKYLTIWGIIGCTTYFGLALKYQNSPHKSVGWKITYVLGEVVFSVESLIAPFFFFYIFPWMLKNRTLSKFDIFSQICLHFLAPLTIWIETLCNQMKFPKRHAGFLGIFILAYSINNYFWTTTTNKPIYPNLDWKSLKSLLVGLVSVGLLFFGYWVGNFQSSKKTQYKASKSPK